MKQSVIVVKRAGQLIPTDFIEMVLKKNQGAGGYAVQAISEQDNETPELVVDTLDRSPTVEEVDELQRAYQKYPVMFWFGDGQFSTESLQPFALHMDDHPFIAYCIEGDFPRYAKPEQSETEEYHLHHDLITPSIMKAFKYSAGSDGEPDLEKFDAELRDPTVSQNLMNTIAHRGVINFLPLTGEMVSIGKNELGGEFEWGFTSNKFDYALPAEASAPPAKKGWWNKKQEPKGSMKVEEKVPEAPKETEKPPVIVNQPKEVPPETETKVEGWYETVTIPTNLGAKDKKIWIRKVSGQSDLPAGWRQLKSIQVFRPGPKPAEQKQEPKVEEKKEPVKDLKDLGKAVEEKKAEAPPPKTGMDVAKNSEVFRNTLTKSEKEKLETDLIRYMDYTSGAIPNPQEIQRIEAKYGSFSKQTGVNLNDVAQWHPDKIFDLVTAYPKAAYLLIREALRAAQINSQLTVEDMVGTSTGKAKEETKQAPEPLAPPSGATSKPALPWAKKKVA